MICFYNGKVLIGRGKTDLGGLAHVVWTPMPPENPHPYSRQGNPEPSDLTTATPAPVQNPPAPAMDKARLDWVEYYRWVRRRHFGGRGNAERQIALRTAMRCGPHG